MGFVGQLPANCRQLVWLEGGELVVVGRSHVAMLDPTLSRVISGAPLPTMHGSRGELAPRFVHGLTAAPGGTALGVDSLGNLLEIDVSSSITERQSLALEPDQFVRDAHLSLATGRVALVISAPRGQYAVHHVRDVSVRDLSSSRSLLDIAGVSGREISSVALSPDGSSVLVAGLHIRGDADGNAIADTDNLRRFDIDSGADVALAGEGFEHVSFDIGFFEPLVLSPTHGDVALFTAISGAMFVISHRVSKQKQVSRRLTRLLDPPDEPLRVVAISNDGRHIAARGVECALWRLDRVTGVIDELPRETLLAATDGRSEPIRALAFRDDGPMLAIATEHGVLAW